MGGGVSAFARVAPWDGERPTICGVGLLAGEVWHFWLGVFQAIPFLIISLIIGVLYVTKVVSRKYPRQ